MSTDNNSHIIMTDKITVRSGDESAFIAFQILPKEDKQGFWINSSPFISVAVKESCKEENLRVLSVKAINEGDEILEGSITVTLDDGQWQECKVSVLPKLSPPPRFSNTPKIVFRDGKAVIEYAFDDIGINIDESEISWYRVDNKDRSWFEEIDFTKQSNEKDGRKIAISRDNKPCKEIRLTSADIGKHIKVNIKPKHNNSLKGQSLNIFSAIVCKDNVNSEFVLLNMATMVDAATYSMEPGYFTIRESLVLGESFDVMRRPGLITESMGCGIYYTHEAEIKDMSLIIQIEPECVDGNGFEGPHQYEEVYIKYDPVNQNGYGLRIAGTASDDGKVIFCLYQYKNGNGTPISEEYVSNAFKPGCEINLEVRGDILNAFITYDDGEDFSDLEIRAKIKGNLYGGFGFKHMAETGKGYRCCLKYLEARYENNLNKK